MTHSFDRALLRFMAVMPAGGVIGAGFGTVVLASVACFIYQAGVRRRR